MKSFEELYNEFNSDKEINDIGQEVIKEVEKRKKVTTILCLAFSAIAIYVLYKYHIGVFIKNVPTKVILIPALMGLLIPTMMINIIIMVITTSIYSKKQRKFLPVFKEKVIKKMIGNFVDNVEYFPEKQMPQQIYKEGKYESYENYYSDDYTEAKIDNKYLIELAEVKTEEERTETDSDGHTTTRRITLFSRTICQNIYRQKH